MKKRLTDSEVAEMAWKEAARMVEQGNEIDKASSLAWGNFDENAHRVFIWIQTHVIPSLKSRAMIIARNRRRDP